MPLWMSLDAPVTVSDAPDCPARTGAAAAWDAVPWHEAHLARRYISVTVSDTGGCP
jgi:hypothetical protein